MDAQLRRDRLLPEISPSCNVGIGRRWYAGEIRSWFIDDSSWWAWVTYYTRIDTAFAARLPAADVRPLDLPDEEWAQEDREPGGAGGPEDSIRGR